MFCDLDQKEVIFCESIAVTVLIFSHVWCQIADLPKWLVVDEGDPVHVTLTPADILATFGMPSPPCTFDKSKSCL